MLIHFAFDLENACKIAKEEGRFKCIINIK